MTNKKIAILGSSGHIAKNLIFYLSQKNNLDLYLFSKNKNKVVKFLNKISINKKRIIIDSYNNFEKNKYQTIINCIGNIKDLKNNKSNFVNINEYYDDKVLKYLNKNKSCLYIYLSSGAVYGENFTHSVNEKSELNLNSKNTEYQYSKAKIKSEEKHRGLSELNIVDLRVFSFFSRFMNLKSKFFISETISSLKSKKQFLTNKIDIKRDYIHPYDFCEIILCCIKKQTINDVFDVVSKKPIKKFQILKFLEKKYDLKYKINEKHISKLIKINYYSNSKKLSRLGYKPKFTSLETIKIELDAYREL